MAAAFATKLISHESSAIGSVTRQVPTPITCSTCWRRTCPRQYRQRCVVGSRQVARQLKMRMADRVSNLEGDFPSSDNEGALSCLPHLRAKRPREVGHASGDLLCEVKFAKNVLLNLTRCGLRKLVDEPPNTRDLVRGQTFSTELQQFLLGDLIPGLIWTNPTGTSPQSRSGIPTIEAPMTAGCV